MWDQFSDAARPKKYDMNDASAPARSVRKRDFRVDALRGLSLLMIFVDHIPSNFIGYLTLRNYSLSDAAEVFVLLAGFSSMLAYGGAFERGGVISGMRRVLKRVLTLYLSQVGLLLATLVIVRLWTLHFKLEPRIVGPLLRDGIGGVVRGITLEALPSYLDILPLYLALIGIFPLIYLGLRASIVATLCISAAIWAAVNFFQMNLPNLVAPEAASTWYFNPLAWQFIFVCGAVIAMVHRRSGGTGLPRSSAVIAICCLYLLFAAFVVASWRGWTFLDHDAFSIEVFDNDEKTYLSPWRIVNVLALVYVILTSDALRRAAESRWLHPLVLCGRHSLVIFSAGTLLALAGRLTFRTFGSGLPVQSLVNGIGLASLIGIAIVLDAYSRRKKERMIAADSNRP